jgi:hypothetical protein
MGEGNGRLAPLTGVAFIVIVIIGFVVGGEPPDLDDGTRELVEHYTDNKDSIMVGSAIVTLGTAMFVFFGGYLRSVLTAAGDAGFLPTVAFAGTVIFAVGAAIDATISFALAETADEISGESVVTLSALWENDFMPFALGILIFLMATGLSIVRTGALPKWLGWIMILVALTAITPIGFVAFLGTALLVLVLSVLLTIRAGRRSTA